MHLGKYYIYIYIYISILSGIASSLVGSVSRKGNIVSCATVEPITAERSSEDNETCAAQVDRWDPKAGRIDGWDRYTHFGRSWRFARVCERDGYRRFHRLFAA